MINGTPNIEQLKKEGKQVVAHGFGVNKMMSKCYDGGWNNKNSTLYVRNAGDLDSEFWVVAEKPQAPKVLKETYELQPRTSHKSFYGKAKVKVYLRGHSEIKELYSYDTLIITIRITKQGNKFVTRNYDLELSNTTTRHLMSFINMRKAEFEKLPLDKEVKYENEITKNKKL